MGLNDAAYGVSVPIVCGFSKLLLNNGPGVDPLRMSSYFSTAISNAEER